MRESVERSGYLLEQRATAILSKRGYFVEANSAYPDPETGISREYDISAISAIKLSEHWRDRIFSFIICECENNAQPVVFFQSESPISFLHYEQVKCSGTPIKLWNGKGYTSTSDRLGFDKFHHYCKGPKATQYCSFTRKNDKAPWIAMHSESHHHTFTSIINALEAATDDHYSSWRMPVEGEQEPINIQFYYPLLVLQGDLYLAQLTKSGLILEAKSHVQYRREVWSAKRRDIYQIDVIRENFMTDYLRIVDREMEAIKRRLKRRTKVIRETNQRLIS
jgi:hypothetical protein